MTENPTISFSTASSTHELRSGIIAFVVGVGIFFITSVIFIAFGGTPPSTTPVTSLVGHAGWFMSVVFVAIGTIIFVLHIDALRAGIAGYLTIGTLLLGVFTGLQWVTWAWVDVLAAQHDQYQLLLKSLISPFGSGLALMYGLFVGGGVGFLSWGIRSTQLTHRVVSLSGMVIGIIALFGTGAVLLSASKNAFFAVSVLVIPIVYLWTFIFAIDIFRRQ